MTYDLNALIQTIQEAERSLALATSEIVKRDERIHLLEDENQRLRDRLAHAMNVIAHYESPEE